MGLVPRGYLSISEAYEKIVATLGPHPRPSDDYLLSLDEEITRTPSVMRSICRSIPMRSSRR
jgi:hypothetical protein